MGMYCEDAVAGEKDRVTQCLQLLDAHMKCEGKTLTVVARELRDRFGLWPDAKQEDRNGALLATVNEPPQSCPVGDGACYFEFVEAVPKSLTNGKARKGARWVLAKRRSVALQEPDEADVADLFG
jgi:hypothetical protein